MQCLWLYYLTKRFLGKYPLVKEIIWITSRSLVLWKAIRACKNDAISNLHVNLMSLQCETTAAQWNGKMYYTILLMVMQFFPLLNWITGSHKPTMIGTLNMREKEEYKAMKSVWVTAEWPLISFVICSWSKKMIFRAWPSTKSRDWSLVLLTMIMKKINHEFLII